MHCDRMPDGEPPYRIEVKTNRRLLTRLLNSYPYPEWPTVESPQDAYREAAREVAQTRLSDQQERGINLTLDVDSIGDHEVDIGPDGALRVSSEPASRADGGDWQELRLADLTDSEVIDITDGITEDDIVRQSLRMTRLRDDINEETGIAKAIARSDAALSSILAETIRRSDLTPADIREAAMLLDL